ncbi:MAG: nitrate ABC transporter ATP-binding protein [Cohaesibacter sp.]|nr:nitrate ABC transporter ATP-binding protein [Cohaesibacter sp.]
MAILECSGLSIGFGEGDHRNEVLDDIFLSVEEGEFVAILGFSGSGKTTLISAMAGLVEPDKGGVIYRGKQIDGPGPERGLVFQSYSLMPWLSVFGNVMLAVDSVFADKPKSERIELANHYIDMVGLTHAKERKPAELSGGMRQRVSVARALAMRPEILLLDEPLSALDALTRAKLQDEFAEISQKEKKTIILITNDVDEAILLADRVIPLTPGPKAKLGPEFKINLPHPRDRGAVNSDADFIHLRASITDYLMQVGLERGMESDELASLPNVISLEQARQKDSDPTKNEANGESLRERYVDFSRVTKVYPTPKGPLTVVEDFDLKIKEGEFITLIGHSGCGKSTVLSMASGLNSITSGGIILAGKEIIEAGPDKAVVFQSPSLMPWLSAYENVMLGVEQVFPTLLSAERRDIVDYYLSIVGLGDAMHQTANDMSNGMRQRVGIARAFALSPKLLLLDEPFGMLDSLTRWELQDVLMDVWRQTKVSAICVTHDVDEAILLADRVVMMSNGPRAKIGNIMEVDLPHPRSRKDLLAHADYYAYREELLDFLEAYEGGANPDQEQLLSIQKKRAARMERQSKAGNPAA